MRRMVWLIPVLAAALTLVGALWPTSAPPQEDSPLRAVFGAPDGAEARRKISIPFGFTDTELRHNSRQVDATGLIACGTDPDDDRFRVRVEIQQGDAFGWGITNGKCTGDEQTWDVRVVARGPHEFHAGDATGQWFFTFYKDGKVVEQVQGDPVTLHLGAEPVE